MKGNNPFFGIFFLKSFIYKKIETRVKAEKYRQFFHQNNFFSKSNRLFLNFVFQNAWGYQLQCKPLNVIIIGHFFTVTEI